MKYRPTIENGFQAVQRVLVRRFFLPFFLFPLGLAFAQCSLTQPSQAQIPYVQPGSIPPRLALSGNFNARLQGPGNERLVMTGTIIRAATSGTFTLTSQIPNMIRLDVTESGGTRTVGFDGAQSWVSAGADLQASDADLLETVTYDMAEQLFLMFQEHSPVRTLGYNFGLSPNVGKKYVGPAYGVFVVPTSVRVTVPPRFQNKYYLLNAGTQLIDRVQYTNATDKTAVVVLVEAWMQVQGNTVPKTIRRLENGIEVVNMTVNSATLMPGLVDTTFCVPR